MGIISKSYISRDTVVVLGITDGDLILGIGVELSILWIGEITIDVSLVVIILFGESILFLFTCLFSFSTNFSMGNKLLKEYCFSLFTLWFDFGEFCADLITNGLFMSLGGNALRGITGGGGNRGEGGVGGSSLR